MHQKTLFKDRPSIDERFAEFVAANEWFVAECILRAREHKAAGNKRWSMKAIFELTRHKFRNTSGRYGLNNSYTSLMARLVIERAPDLKGFFELR